MTSQRPYTYEEIAEWFAAHYGSVRRLIRKNTFVEPGDTFASFLVFLYGTNIATLYSDGSVRINRRGWTSATTRNRINDVLFPLGWRLYVKDGRWLLQTIERPHKVMEYVDNMILTRVSNKEG